MDKNFGISGKDIKNYSVRHECSLQEARLILVKQKLSDMAAGACSYDNMSALWPVISFLIESLK